MIVLTFVLFILAFFLSGFPVAFCLIIGSLAFALLASVFGAFDIPLLAAIAPRLFGVLTNPVLLAVPMFVFMGLVLDKSGIARDMFQKAGQWFGQKPAGTLASVTVVGVLLAATTGIVGASVVTLALLGLPVLMARNVPAPLAAGSVAAAGTLGQIIPPSIVLIVLGDQMSNAYQQAQTNAGNFAPDSVTVADLFAGALVPGLLLAALYLGWQLLALRKVAASLDDPIETEQQPTGSLVLLSPFLLILAVLGSILSGVATPVEAASLGSVAALTLGFVRNGDFGFLPSALREAVYLVSVIFAIVIGASIFSLVMRGLGGDVLIESALADLPGGTYGALALVMLAIFLLGFFLEFLEITYIVVPLVVPVLLAMPVAGQPMSPVWLGVLIAINLQTSFLTPPFGVSLFYLRSAAPSSISTMQIYRGVIPFIALQLLMLALVAAFPALATWLPNLVFVG